MPRHPSLAWPLALLVALAAAGPACSRVLAPAATVAAEPAPARPAIEILLREMTAAVNTADQARYLACISDADPVFATEQRNWAADLGRQRPEKFETRLADPEADLTPGPDGAVAADLVFEWQMPEQRERSLTIPVQFVRGGPGWLYAGERWRLLEREGGRVMYFRESEDVAQTVAEVLPAVRRHVHEVFDLEHDADLTGRIQEVKLYRTVQHLQQSIYLSYSTPLAGWNEPGESIKIISGSSDKPAMRRLLAHEYGHVASFQLGPKANDMPWWVLEGVAELSADRYGGGRKSTERRVRAWAESGKLVDWDKLADFHGEATRHAAHVYAQGHHMLCYISERFGAEGRNRWLRAMAEGASLDDATRSTLGLPFEQLDAEWRQSLTAAEDESTAE